MIIDRKVTPGGVVRSFTSKIGWTSQNLNAFPYSYKSEVHEPFTFISNKMLDPDGTKLSVSPNTIGIAIDGAKRKWRKQIEQVGVQ